MRVNSAADDAAGLAIRELMRADIAALTQGQRNANDAISMIQVADSAFTIIDEKLTRMKELAEQAATGTYDSVQRLVIDSEFQAMGEEIDRIAHATDFNGIKLLDGNITTWFADEEIFAITNGGSISNLIVNSTLNNCNILLNDIDANNYIDYKNPKNALHISLTASEYTRTITEQAMSTVSVVRDPELGIVSAYYILKDKPYYIVYSNSSGRPENPVFTYDGKDWLVEDDTSRQNPDPAQQYYTAYTTGSTLYATYTTPPRILEFYIMDMKSDNFIPYDRMEEYGINYLQIDIRNSASSTTISHIDINNTGHGYTASYDEEKQIVTINLDKGGTAVLNLAAPLNAGDTIDFDINFEGETTIIPLEHTGVDPSQKIEIHFGTGNDSAEDYYYIEYQNCTRKGLGLKDVFIKTQQEAQKALLAIKSAMVLKDNSRAYMGAMQNRLENTAANLKSQAENLQTSESEISDANVAKEMMNFVRNQILTQSAVAMLAQANSMPQMALGLIRARSI